MHLSYSVHIRQSMIFNRNVVNTSLIFKSLMFLSIISFADKPPALPYVSVDELLFNPNSLIITEGLSLLQTRVILPVA